MLDIPERHSVGSLIELIYHQFESTSLSYGHGTDNAWDEAVALVLTLTGFADDPASLGLVVSQEQVQSCLSAAAQRTTTRQPLPYILGECRYMGWRFLVKPGVVVPRSPIGYLLQEGLQPWMPKTVLSVLDLCSGSGCLGIIAAHLFPQATVCLVEVDQHAIAVANANIELHGLQDRVSVRRADVTLPLSFETRFDLILTNPPYVDAADMRTLPAEFTAEPDLGLAAGDDGLSVIAPILEQASNWLSEAGLFVGEVGASARALNTRYSSWPLLWLDLPLGGEGVFLLEAAALNSHTAPDSHSALE